MLKCDIIIYKVDSNTKEETKRLNNKIKNNKI